MSKEGFGSQNSMALVESATVDGKDMQITNVNKLLIHERESLRSNMHFVISKLLHATYQ